MSIEVPISPAANSPNSWSMVMALSNATAYGLIESSENSTDKTSTEDWLMLYSHGCLSDSGIWNCTEACQDVNQIFSSIYTLQNCVAFPQISSLLTNGSLTETARSNALKAAIDEGSYNASDTVYHVISECFQAWCDQHSDCAKDHNRPERCYDDAYGKRYCFKEPCVGMDFSVNPDIGGIGVMSMTSCHL